MNRLRNAILMKTVERIILAMLLIGVCVLATRLERHLNESDDCVWAHIPTLQTANILDGGMQVEMCVQTGAIRVATKK